MNVSVPVLFSLATDPWISSELFYDFLYSTPFKIYNWQVLPDWVRHSCIFQLSLWNRQRVVCGAYGSSSSSSSSSYHNVRICLVVSSNTLYVDRRHDRFLRRTLELYACLLCSAHLNYCSSLKVVIWQIQDGPKFDGLFTGQLSQSLQQQSTANRSFDGRPESPWYSSRLGPHSTHVAAFKHRTEGELP